VQTIRAPVVSVITPTYAVGGVSRRNQLRRAYNSLLAQSPSDWEWLVVGDGCVDDTGRLVQTWAITDCRVSWYNLQDHTGHPSSPRNAALAKARGRYLAFLDDDAVMGSDKLRLLTNYLETHPGCELVWGNRALYNSEEDYLGRRMAMLCSDSRQGLDMGDTLVRNLGYRFTDSTSGCEDQVFFAQFKKPWGHVDALVNHYIWHGNNRTGERMKTGINTGRIVQQPGIDFSALVREIPGYSAPGVLGLLNQYVSSLPSRLCYAEVGSLHGLTLVGALLGNTARALAIDNFSEFGGTEATLRATLDHYRVAARVELFPTDFKEVFTEGKLPRQSVGVYFYDGQHTDEAQTSGLKLAEPFLAPGAIVVVDDTNWPAPRKAIEHWIEEHDLEVLQDIHTEDFRTSLFWNGLIVCRWKEDNDHSSRIPAEQCPVPLLQYPREFDALLDLYRTLKPGRVLEIGSLFGGTLWHWLRYAPPDALILNIDALVSAQDDRYAPQKAGHDGLWAEWASRFGVRLKTFCGPSSDVSILAKVRTALTEESRASCTQRASENIRPCLDFLFLDGDHSYPAAKSDYYNYGALVRPGGLIALHDILDRPTSQVARLWREIVLSGAKTRELIQSPDQPEMGIGVVYL
jgi:predicted O-methyltransferase YrrM